MNTQSASSLQELEHAYSAPLRSYSGVLGTYGAAVSLLALVGRVRGVRLPERFSVQDTVLLCAATHKASRLLSKQAVTSPLRAPFTRYEESTGGAEVKESARGDGPRRVVGELLTCPFCIGVWIASGLAAGMVFAPRITRLVTSTLTAVAFSDVAQLLYERAREPVT